MISSSSYDAGTSQSIVAAAGAPPLEVVGAPPLQLQAVIKVTNYRHLMLSQQLFPIYLYPLNQETK